MSTADLQAVLVQTAMQQLNRVLGPKPSFTQQLASFVGIGASAPYVSLTLLGRPVRITERRTEYSYSHKVYRVLIEDCDSMTLFHGDERTSRNEARLAAIAKYLKYCLELDFTLTVKDEEKRETDKEIAERLHIVEDMLEARARRPPPAAPDVSSRYASDKRLEAYVLQTYASQSEAERRRASFKTQEHALLVENLAVLGWCERSFIPADGNCQFHAVADQLDHMMSYRALRAIAVEWMQRHADRFSQGMDPRAFAAYLATMSRDSTYGDHRTLQALADALLLNICVVTTEPGGFIIHINPAPEAVPLVESQSQREPVTIYLSLAAEHYGSVETSQITLLQDPESCTLSTATLISDNAFSDESWLTTAFYGTEDLKLHLLQPDSGIVLRAEQAHLAGRVGFYRHSQLRVPPRTAQDASRTAQQSYSLLNLQHRALIDRNSGRSIPDFAAIDLVVDIFAGISDGRASVSCFLAILQREQLFVGPRIIVRTLENPSSPGSKLLDWVSYRQYRLSETDFTPVRLVDSTIELRNPVFRASERTLFGLLTNITHYGEDSAGFSADIGIDSLMIILHPQRQQPSTATATATGSS